ncbi:MAG: diguanylate cyclase [Candidatus Aegiribacteria sp.]|nr:diguanylate cyclase [Candidatus Aegiribacteria sp.]MBD3294817.1 diguanylate cyclase [Candidatus Fermentibacteria bacterium]
MKIIIADDDPISRKILSKVVSDMDYDPITVDNGRDALDCIRHNDCSVVLLDWMMPGMDGIEVCREIRRMETENEHVCYIIINSAREGSDDISWALKAGANDYISKKTDSLELKARIGVGVRTAQLEKKLIDLNNRLKFLVRTDSLTGLLNHAAILKELSMELDRGKRDNSSTSVLMIDLDRFKAVNDTYGHQTGDRVLMNFANLLLQSCRSFDRIGRYGGEEFLIVLPRTNAEESVSIGNRIRSNTVDLPVDEKNENLRITCSIGCCTATMSEKHSSSIVAAADSALFRAKKAGRNTVIACK